MTRHGIRAQVSALIAAYALVLHALLAGMAPAGHLANASSASAIICTGVSGADQPAGQDQPDHSSCTLHCLFAGGAMDAWMPAASAVFATFAPADIRVSILQPIETLGPIATQRPQIPRAPPTA